MSKQDRRLALLAGFLIFLAAACRFFDRFTDFQLRAGWLRSAIYIGLFCAWGVSVHSRILQKQTRQYLSAVAALMVFWISARTVKYLCIPSDGAAFLSRYLWYLYYLPMLFIPLLALLVAMSLGMPEGTRLPGWTALLYVPTAALVALVLTNDLHQTVFTFPKDADQWLPSNHGYGIGYCLVASWMCLCALLTLAVMLKKCRLPFDHKRIWLPMIPILILLVYTALYYKGVSWLRFVAGDITVVNCLLYAATLELCIRCGLIRSNTRYRALFDASTIGAQITDDDGNVCLCSDTARKLPQTLMRQAETAPVLLDGGIRLCAAPIRGGHMVWQENISDLLCVLEKLDHTKKELQEYAGLLTKENEKKRRRCELEEQKRLYEAVQNAVAPAMEQLARLIRSLHLAKDEETAKRLHGNIAVVGAYLKRRGNLVFLADRTGTVPCNELRLCLHESASDLRLAGTACAVSFDLEGNMNAETAGRLYDFFEEVVETAYSKLSALNVMVTQETRSYSMLLMWEGAHTLTLPSERFADATVDRDEDTVYCRLRVLKEENDV